MIQSVARAFALLEALHTRGAVPMSLGELAGLTGLKAPTAHNLLATLAALGYVEHDAETRRYALGEKARALGRWQFIVSALVDAAHPVLQGLQEELGETVLLALYRDGRRDTVAAVESAHSLRVGGATGTDDRLYGTATGRVLLSLLADEALDAFVRERGLPGDEWPGIGTGEQLAGELRRIRAARFVALRPAGGDVQAAAVPVVVSEPHVQAALGMYYPTVRPPRGGTRRIRTCLGEAAERIATAFAAR